MRVKNTGIGVAERCKATLQIKKWEGNIRAPSKEPKALYWESGQESQDIGAVGGAEGLNVVLSDSRSSPPTSFLAKENAFAFVCTPDTVKHNDPIRAQDAMSAGGFEFELVVTSIKGHSIKATLVVSVTTNWEELNMRRIS